MLGKLFKYEWKFTARIFLPLMGILAVFSILNKLLYSEGVGNALFSGRMEWISLIIYAVSSIIYGVLIGAAFMATILVLIQRFAKNLLGDEGYLMMTLPVKPWEHIVSKLLVGGIWSIINIAVAFLSIMFMAMDGSGWVHFWNSTLLVIRETVENVGILGFVELVLIPLVWAFGGMLPIYACICLGQQLRKHKIIGAIICYVAFGTVAQMIFVGIIRLCVNIEIYMSGQTAYHAVMFITLAYSLLCCGISFIVTNYLLNKKLNLE